MGGRFGELLLILIIALLLFGPNKLPSLAKALGEALKEFKKASNPDGDNKAAASETKSSKDNSAIS
jgi:sec-independent protein translocase protein TatA